MKKILLNGKEISSCRIVYGESALRGYADSKTGKSIGEDIGLFLQGDNRDCEFDRQSAVRLAEIIKKFSGYELETVRIADAGLIRKGDILVGEAATTDERIPLMSYVCKPTDGTYSIRGGSYGATWHAIDRIEKYLMQCTNDTVDLADAGDLSGTYRLKTVACLGDSITRGSQSLPDGNGFGTPDGLTASYGPVATSHYFEQFLSYPANLQRALWKEYLIFNFGQGLATMRNCLDEDGNRWKFYYHGTQKYKNCLEMSDRDDFSFDAVLIMLGTNDAGKEGGAKDWNEEQKADYQNEAEMLLREILVGSPNAKFVLMNVPHRCDSYQPSASSCAMRKIQKAAAIALKRKGYDVYHFDMNAYTSANMGNGHGDTKEAEIEAHADYYNIRTETGKPDTTHPNYRGYAKIAEGVNGLVAYLLDGAKAPKYMIDLD